VKGFRKMGHFTITASTISELKEKAERLKNTIKALGR
jgi:phosphoribosylaminoimidazole carboxylase (NCAIR synthetase)